jgi:hypothetical protein
VRKKERDGGREKEREIEKEREKERIPQGYHPHCQQW